MGTTTTAAATTVVCTTPSCGYCCSPTTMRVMMMASSAVTTGLSSCWLVAVITAATVGSLLSLNFLAMAWWNASVSTKSFQQTDTNHLVTVFQILSKCICAM